MPGIAPGPLPMGRSRRRREEEKTQVTIIPPDQGRIILVIDGAWRTMTKAPVYRTQRGNWMFQHGVGFDNAPHVVKNLVKGEQVIRTITLMGYPGSSSRYHEWVPCGVMIDESTVLVNPQKDNSEFSKEFYGL